MVKRVGEEEVGRNAFASFLFSNLQEAAGRSRAVSSAETT